MTKRSSETMDLPDINVWLALCDEDHIHHPSARAYWEISGTRKVAFCRVTMLGLLRLATNAKAMNGKPFTPSEAWDAYQAFLGLPEVAFVHEPVGMDTILGTWTGSGLITSALWTDAFLAALSIETGCRLVSFDRDFQRFHQLQFLQLPG